MSLCDMNIGEIATIYKVDSSGDIKRRILDMGIVPGTKVECFLKSPFGNLKAYLVRNTLVALREEDSKRIKVKLV